MIKIPKAVDISGHQWKVLLVSESDERLGQTDDDVQDDETVVASHNTRTHEIYLCKSWDTQHQFTSLFHEVFHIMFPAFAERTICRMEDKVWSFLRHNPEITNYVTRV